MSSLDRIVNGPLRSASNDAAPAATSTAERALVVREAPPAQSMATPEDSVAEQDDLGPKEDTRATPQRDVTEDPRSHRSEPIPLDRDDRISLQAGLPSTTRERGPDEPRTPMSRDREPPVAL